MRRATALCLLLPVLTQPAAARSAPARLTEPAVRAFVARQEAAWNGKDPKAFAALFTPDAHFVDQARGSDNSIVPYGQSTLAEAIAQARRFFAGPPFHETAQVVRIQIAADGRSAVVFGRETTRIDAPGRAPRILCADTEQTVVLQAGRLLSRGQTDTAVRCNAAH